MRTTKKLKVDEKRLLAYAVAAGAVLAAAGPADASVVYGKVDKSMEYNSGSYLINIVDIGGSNIGAINFSNYNLLSTSDKNPNHYSTVAWAGAGATGMESFGVMVQGTLGSAMKLPAGANVGPSGDFSSAGKLFQHLNMGNPLNFGLFLEGDGYLGFKIKTVDNIAYGWVHLDNFNLAPKATSYRIVDWAYQNDGTTITSGEGATAVPEPTSSALALIAMGAAGVAIYRKRKQDAQG